jgi:hypothetical protein
MFDLTKPKWIIQDGELLLGRVVSHRDLAKKNEFGGTPKVRGGGLWHYEEEGDTLYLYAKSIDFGQVSVNDFENIWVRPSLENSKIFFSTEMSLELAKKNNTIIQDLNEGEVL